MDTYHRTTPDLAQLLPQEVFQEIVHILRGALPAPEAEAPAALARRDRAAAAAVAALLPANAAEGRLAAQYVAADAWALDCLRLARERRREPGIAFKCKAQAMAMMREGKSALRTLLRLQAARRAIEADPADAERAAWIEHGTARMMQAALAPAAGEPVRHEGMDDRHDAVVDGGPHATVSDVDVGSASHFAINLQVAPYETAAGLLGAAAGAPGPGAGAPGPGAGAPGPGAGAPGLGTEAGPGGRDGGPILTQVGRIPTGGETDPSCPGLSRVSTPFTLPAKPWMAGTRPAKTVAPASAIAPVGIRR